MSDWGATHSTSIMAGLDQEMPSAQYMNDAAIGAGIAAKNITEAAVDDSVTRILTGMFLAGVMDKFDEDKMAYDFSKHSANVTSESAANLARELSANSTVLLKNEGGVLPLTATDKIALIGLADQDNALTHGGGSGQVTPSWTITPLAGISAAAGKGMVTYDPGTDATKAAAAAKAADVAVVFVGSLSSEGSDRKSLSLDDGSVKAITAQDALIEAVVAANPKTIVVLTVPGAILMPWSPKVAGIFINFMPGQQAGHAIADCLFGKVNPSGKLPLTMPNKENEQDFTDEQWPGLPDPGTPIYANYTEKLLVGYRYYDAKKIDFTTGFPFGHGLSYTSFKYSDVKATSTSISATVVNTGKVSGSEVAQMYLGFPEEAGEPPKQLKGFKKVMLAPGASATVEFPLTEWSTAIWDVSSHGWKPVKGEFDVWVGTSSRELPLTTKLTM
jgi:beta-glucosidase